MIIERKKKSPYPLCTYDRVHVNGSACGHLKHKLITHSFLVRNAWSDMSFEPQGNIVHENIKFMGIKNVFQCFSTRYLKKNQF